MIEVPGNAEYADGALSLAAGAQPIAGGVEIGGIVTEGVPVARAEVTLATVSDVSATRRYYILQSASAAAPGRPTSNPPIGWSETEPTRVAGSSTALYVVDLTEYADGTWAYSPVSKSTSYDAAVDVGRTATDFIEWKAGEGLRVGHKDGAAWDGTSTLMASDGFKVLDAAGGELSSFGAEDVSLCGGAAALRATKGSFGKNFLSMRTVDGIGFGTPANEFANYPALVSWNGACAIYGMGRILKHTGASSNIWSNLLAALVLYDDASGVSDGAIELVGGIRASGFVALDIVFADETREYSQRVYADGGEVKTSISRTVSNAASAAVYVASATIETAGAALTVSNNVQAQISAGGIEIQGAVLKVTKVIGWR